MRRRTGGAVLILVATLACGGFVAWGSRPDHDDRDHDPANRPGYSAQTKAGEGTGNDDSAKEPDTNNGRDKDGRDVDHVVTGETGGRREAVFAMIRGTDVVRVRSADLGGDLYRISTPDDSKVAPSVHVDDGTVYTSTVDTGRSGPAIVIAELSSAVRWHVRLGGGANEEIVDLTHGKVKAVELDAGTSRAEVTLPAAAGTTRVTMSGGASQLLIHLRGDDPVQVRAGAGAGRITVDRFAHAGVAGGTVFTPAHWSKATDRYDIDAIAGVANLTIDRR